MTSTDLVVQSTAYSRSTFDQRREWAIMIAKAGDLLPPHLQAGIVRDPNTGQMVKMGSAGKAFMLAETGDMLGIHPMAAFTGVHIIEGKPSISANLMAGLVRKAGHKLRVSVSGSAEDETLSATAQLIRGDDPDFTFEVTWNVGKAKRAELWPGKPASNWRKYPDAMMKARAVSEVIREGAPDVLMGGNVYTPEELGADVNEQGDPIEFTQVPDQPMPDAPVSQRETPPAEPRQQAPIVDEQPPAEPAAEGEFDWVDAIVKLENKAQAGALWQKAKHEGKLNAPIRLPRQRKDRTLDEAIREVGEAFAAAEAAEAAAEADGAAEADVVHAEIVEDGDAPMALGEEQQQ